MPTDADFMRLSTNVEHLATTVERLDGTMQRIDDRAQERDETFLERIHGLELFRAKMETRNRLLAAVPAVLAAILGSILSAMAVFHALGGGG